MTASLPTHAETTSLGMYYPAVTVKNQGPLLVATDRSENSLRALKAAEILDRSMKRGVKVVAVIEPLPIIVPEPSSLLQPLVITPELADIVRKQTLSQVQQAGAAADNWKVEVQEGRPATAIAESARDSVASAVILGLSHHSLVDRFLDGDTALEVLRESDTPVLLASSSFESIPKRVVIAVDFSPESMEAARTAIPFLAPDARVELVHVRPAVTIFDGSGLWEQEYEQVAWKQLDQFRNTLAAPATMEVTTKIVTGQPANALISFADSIDADLIVSGSHGAGLMRRIFIGSVASGLLRKSSRSLLIVPKPSHQQK